PFTPTEGERSHLPHRLHRGSPLGAARPERGNSRGLPPPSMKSPVLFGKYLLLERVNVGGMAEVFIAKAFGIEGFERVLAVKKILPSMASDNEFITMFIDEAR